LKSIVPVVGAYIILHTLSHPRQSIALCIDGCTVAIGHGEERNALVAYVLSQPVELVAGAGCAVEVALVVGNMVVIGTGETFSSRVGDAGATSNSLTVWGECYLWGCEWKEQDEQQWQQSRGPSHRYLENNMTKQWITKNQR
jgi:hypothetical protein